MDEEEKTIERFRSSLFSTCSFCIYSKWAVNINQNFNSTSLLKAIVSYDMFFKQPPQIKLCKEKLDNIQLWYEAENNYLYYSSQYCIRKIYVNFRVKIDAFPPYSLPSFDMKNDPHIASETTEKEENKGLVILTIVNDRYVSS